MTISIKNLVLAQELLVLSKELLANISNKNYYHGTSHDFTTFDLSQAGLRDYGDFGYGIYLTPNARLAASYARDSAKESGKEPKVFVVRVRSTKTADFDDIELQKSVMESTGVPFPKKLVPGQKQTRPKQEAMSITQFMLDSGYDSALARNGNELVVYKPALIDVVKVVTLEDAAYMV